MKITKICLFLLVLLFAILSLSVYGETAEDITALSDIECNGKSAEDLCDNSIATHMKMENAEIVITSEMPMGGLYIKYNGVPTEGTLDGNRKIAQNGFVHEYVFLDSPLSVRLEYENTDISEIYVFSVGEVPEYVQRWNVPQDNADILLCATHSDDDQLFFAGVLPYYAKIKRANVVVSYFVNHYDTYNRTHELLDGLWHCGVTNYPDISAFPDGYSESVEGAVSFLEKNGFSYDDVLENRRLLLEKYKPLVCVLHDFDGEYGHGAHMLNTKSFVEAAQLTTGYKPEKIYVHLYEQEKIVLSLDEPSAALLGLSPFQVSQEAFEYHKSQHWTWFYQWIYGKNGEITSSQQIRSYNPAEYGLYYTSVGEDVNKNCFLENVTLYSDREKQEQEMSNKNTSADVTESEKEYTEAKKDVNEKDKEKSNNKKEKNINTKYIFVFVIATMACVAVTTVIIKKKR